MDSRPSSRIARALLFATLIVPGCSARPEPEETVEAVPHLRLAATAPTVAWLAEQVGGPGLETELIWPNESELTEQQLIALSEADLIVQHGAGLDGWTDALEISALGHTDISQDLTLIEKEGSAHSHGEEPEHQHREALPGTWHDPDLLISGLNVLLDLLAKSHPAAIDRKKADELRDQMLDLSALADELAAALENTEIRAEDEFRYLARRLQQGSSDDGAGEQGSGADLRFVLRRTSAQTLKRGPAGEGEEQPILLEPLLPHPVDGYVELLRRNLNAVRRAIVDSLEANGPEADGPGIELGGGVPGERP